MNGEKMRLLLDYCSSLVKKMEILLLLSITKTAQGRSSLSSSMNYLEKKLPSIFPLPQSLVNNLAACNETLNTVFRKEQSEQCLLQSTEEEKEAYREFLMGITRIFKAFVDAYLVSHEAGLLRCREELGKMRKTLIVTSQKGVGLLFSSFFELVNGGLYEKGIVC